jgi:hypothetical protein
MQTVKEKTIREGSHKRFQRFIENCLIVWLDPNIDEDQIEQLRQIINEVHDLSQIEAIYLFCSSNSPEWT